MANRLAAILEALAKLPCLLGFHAWHVNRGLATRRCAACRKLQMLRACHVWEDV